ncbi:MAG: HAMP domain-containing histidine kinase [Kofleriaceae bacterium]|nr:HAMP domain-containing histidine kinase [Kofleriaceae bacterium]
MRSRRAWIYVLSVLALLVPAAGIAYLGAFSYRDDRGAVSAQTNAQKRAAEAIAARIGHQIDEAFAAIEQAIARNDVPRGPLATPLARHWFWIQGDGHILVPRAAPPAAFEASAFDRAPCSGRLEDCVSESTRRQVRLAKLQAAQRAEACRGDGCGAAWQEARRQYMQLAAFEDTGPVALLGLARVYARLGDEKGVEGAVADLELRYGERTVEELPVGLVVATLRAGNDRGALLDIAGSVATGKYDVHPLVALGVIERLRARVAGTLPPDLAAKRSALDEQIASIRTEARAAAGLADDVPELLRDADSAWRGREASHHAGRTLVYKKRSDGSVVGFAVDAAMLEDAAGHQPDDDVAINARPLVLSSGRFPGSDVRPLAVASFGESLPHLALHLVNPIADPDPLDVVIRARSKRHVMYTSALAIMLGLGILATIRGAARARELAQLKSDFVSTVSHELKTPLTSIRMFAEMLEQGVAQGDPAKMARYHGVIVQESQRLGLLIANLLDYSQIERGTRRYTQTKENVAALARDAVTTFETLRDPEKHHRNPIQVEVSPEAMQTEVEVDRDVVIQAILNLLANAAKYGATEDKKAIEVHVGADALGATIAVRDHGPGIPAHEQVRIFREFYRSPEAYRSGIEGTGLGLALVKRHIEALGGTVDVASTVGEGATFTIRLPRPRATDRRGRDTGPKPAIDAQSNKLAARVATATDIGEGA